MGGRHAWSAGRRTLPLQQLYVEVSPDHGRCRQGPHRRTPQALHSPTDHLANARREAQLVERPAERPPTVVLLVGLEGLSYAETAEVLAIPVGTVMSRLARGRGRLRTLMGYEGDDKGGHAALRRVK